MATNAVVVKSLEEILREKRQHQRPASTPALSGGGQGAGRRIIRLASAKKEKQDDITPTVGLVRTKSADTPSASTAAELTCSDAGDRGNAVAGSAATSTVLRRKPLCREKRTSVPTKLEKSSLSHLKPPATSSLKPIIASKNSIFEQKESSGVHQQQSMPKKLTNNAKHNRPLLRRRMPCKVSSSKQQGSPDLLILSVKRPGSCSLTSPQAKIQCLAPSESHEENLDLMSPLDIEKPSSQVSVVPDPVPLMAEAVSAARTFLVEGPASEEVRMETQEDGEICDDREDGEIEDNESGGDGEIADNESGDDDSPNHLISDSVSSSVSEQEDDTVALHIDVDDEMDDLLKNDEKQPSNSMSKSRHTGGKSRGSNHDRESSHRSDDRHGRRRRESEPRDDDRSLHRKHSDHCPRQRNGERESSGMHSCNRGRSDTGKSRRHLGKRGHMKWRQEVSTSLERTSKLREEQIERKEKEQQVYQEHVTRLEMSKQREQDQWRVAERRTEQKRLEEGRKHIMEHKLCRYFLRRSCYHGSNCRFRHVPRDVVPRAVLEYLALPKAVRQQMQCSSSSSSSPCTSAPPPAAVAVNGTADNEELNKALKQVDKLIEAGSIETAWAIMQDLDLHVRLPVMLYERVLSACAQSKETARWYQIAKRAFKKFETLRHTGYTRHDYTQLLHCLCMAEQLDSVFQVYTGMRRKFPPTYDNILEIMGLCAAVEPARVVKLLDDISTYNLYSDEVISWLVRLAGMDLNLLEHVLSAVESAKRQGVNISETTYHELIRVLMKRKDWTWIFKLMESVEFSSTMPGDIFTSAMLSGVENPHYLKGSLALLLSQHAVKHTLMTEEMWSKFIIQCCKSQLLDDASCIWRLAKKYNVRVSVQAASLLIQSLSQSSDAAGAMEAFTEVQDKQQGEGSVEFTSAESMHSLAASVARFRPWQDLYKVILTMFSRGLQPDLLIVTGLLEEMHRSAAFSNIYDLALECIKADVKMPQEFFRQSMMLLTQWDERITAASDIYDALKEHEEKHAQAPHQPREVDKSARKEVEEIVCHLWMSREGCRQERCCFAHPADMRGGLAPPIHEPPVEHQPKDEPSRFAYEMIMHNARNHLWAKMATPFLDMQRNTDLSHVTKEAKSSWFVSAFSSNANCGTAYEEFVKMVLLSTSGSNDDDSCTPKDEEEFTDRLLLALIGIGLLCKCVLEERWSQAYRVLYSLHANQIHYLDRKSIFSGTVNLPGGVSRCMVALYGVQACLAMNEASSAVMVLDASDWAISTTSNVDQRTNENNQRLFLLRRLLKALIDVGDLTKSTATLKQLLLSHPDVPGQAVDILKEAGAACARIVTKVIEANPADLSFALDVHDLFERHNLRCSARLMRSMLSCLIKCAVDTGSIRIARPLFLRAFEQRLYPSVRVPDDRQSIYLAASELAPSEMMLTIEKHLYDLAKLFQQDHHGLEPWSFAIGPHLERQPITLLMRCAVAGQPIQHDERCRHLVSVIKGVLADNFSPSLAISEKPLLVDNCHSLVLKADCLVRWFNANNIDPYIEPSVPNQPTPSGSPSPSPTGQPLFISPSADVPVEREPARQQTSSYASENPRRHPADSQHHLSPSKILRRRSKDSQHPTPHRRESSKASRFPNAESVRKHVAKRICRRLTKLLRAGRFGEGAFKQHAREATHQFMRDLARHNHRIENVRNDDRLEDNIKRFVDNFMEERQQG